MERHRTEGQNNQPSPEAADAPRCVDVHRITSATLRERRVLDPGGVLPLTCGGDLRAGARMSASAENRLPAQMKVVQIRPGSKEVPAAAVSGWAPGACAQPANPAAAWPGPNLRAHISGLEV